MRIGHFNPGLYHPGGICSYITRIARSQAESGHEVLLFDRAGFGASVDDTKIIITQNDEDLFRMASEKKLDILHLHSHCEIPDASVKTVRTLHVHSPYCPSGTRFLSRQGVACNRAYSFSGCTWGHLADRCGSIRPNKLVQDFQRSWQEMRTLPKTRVLADSDFLRLQMLRSRYAMENVHVLLLPGPSISPTVNFLNRRPNNASPSFVFLGRLVRSKGVEWLLRAAAEVKGLFTVEIGGVGPDRERLEKLSEQLGLQSRVHFHGWLDESRALELITDSLAVVFPSLWHEPAGLITPEAASRGRAVIASRVGGIPEYAALTGNAILVEPDDVAALARAMQRLLDDPSEAQRLGEVGFRSMQQGPLHFETHMETLYGHYAAVMG